MPSCGVCPPVCLSVRQSVTIVDCIKTNKHILKNFSLSGSQTILVFPYRTSWQYSDRDPLTGASNAGGVGTNRHRRRYSWLSIDDVLELRTSATIHSAVYRTVGDASVKLYLSQPAACTTAMKRGEQNRIYLYAAVNLKQNLRSMYCLIEATNRHGASRGLSATEELLVVRNYHVNVVIVWQCDRTTDWRNNGASGNRPLSGRSGVLSHPADNSPPFYRRQGICLANLFEQLLE